MRKLILIFLVGILAGCAAPKKQVSLEDMDAALARNEAVAVHLYPGKSLLEVRKAAQQALYLLDPDDMKFDVQSNSLLATRWSTFYAVFTVGFGRDWYSVDLEQTEQGTKARFGFTGQMNAGMFASPIDESFKTAIPTSAHQNEADFKLFHDRVEYLLGLPNQWPTCESAKKALLDAKAELFLCDQLGLENKAPADKKEGQGV